MYANFSKDLGMRPRSIETVEDSMLLNDSMDHSGAQAFVKD